MTGFKGFFLYICQNILDTLINLMGDYKQETIYYIQKPKLHLKSSLNS